MVFGNWFILTNSLFYFAILVFRGFSGYNIIDKC